MDDLHQDLLVDSRIHVSINQQLHHHTTTFDCWHDCVFNRCWLIFHLMHQDKHLPDPSVSSVPEGHPSIVPEVWSSVSLVVSFFWVSCFSFVFLLGPNHVLTGTWNHQITRSRMGCWSEHMNKREQIGVEAAG